MGLAASQARYLYLTARSSDLEYMAQLMNASRVNLSNEATQMISQQADLQPGSAALQDLQYRLSALNSIDQSLELQLRRVDTQHDAVQAEVQSVQQVISKNIQSSFNAFNH